MNKQVTFKRVTFNMPYHSAYWEFCETFNTWAHTYYWLPFTIEMDWIKRVNKWPKLQTTGDLEYELLVVRVTWLFSWQESGIIAQGYISFGEFATNANSKWVI